MSHISHEILPTWLTAVFNIPQQQFVTQTSSCFVFTKAELSNPGDVSLDKALWTTVWSNLEVFVINTDYNSSFATTTDFQDH